MDGKTMAAEGAHRGEYWRLPFSVRAPRAGSHAHDARGGAEQSAVRFQQENFFLSAATIVVLEGDETGQELLVEALRVLDRSVIDIDLAFEHYDLSLAKRRETNNAIVNEAAQAMKRKKLGIKAATIPPAESPTIVARSPRPAAMSTT